MAFTPPTSGILIGMTEAELRAHRARLQKALIELIASDKPVKLSYTQGDGQRMVEYSAGDEAKIRGLITEINVCFGEGRRRAVGLRF